MYDMVTNSKHNVIFFPRFALPPTIAHQIKIILLLFIRILLFLSKIKHVLKISGRRLEK